MNCLTYPCKTMRITQSYTGTTSHYPHTVGSPKDYPIDEGGADGGRDPVYAPVDMIVKRIYGVGTKGTNTVWLESAVKAKLANGKTDYITLMLTHPNDSDLRRLKLGQRIPMRDVICYEGIDGATGNHIHMSVGAGKFAGNGWTQNTKGKYVLTTTGGPLKPEEAFFIDTTFTTVKSAAGLAFKMLPATPGTWQTTENLYIRIGTTEDKIKPTSPNRGVIKKGTRVTVSKVKTGADGNEPFAPENYVYSV